MTILLMWCKHCETELAYRKGELVHAATNRWRCRTGSHIKTVATIGHSEDLDDEPCWSVPDDEEVGANGQG